MMGAATATIAANSVLAVALWRAVSRFVDGPAAESPALALVPAWPAGPATTL
jgi:hypothetical protein